MNPRLKRLGKLLKKYRGDIGVTELARKISTNRETIRKMEMGSNTRIDIWSKYITELGNLLPHQSCVNMKKEVFNILFGES